MTAGARPSPTRDLLSSVVRHLWLFALALVPAFLLLVQPTPADAGHAGVVTISVNAAEGLEARELRLFGAWQRRHVDTFRNLATSNSILLDVIADQDLSTTPRALADRVTIVQPDNREILSFEVTGDGEEETRALTRALGEAVAARIESLAPHDARGRRIVRATALPPSVSQVEPERSLLAPAALGLLGLLAAAAWVLWRFATDDAIRSRRDLESVTSAPVLATVHARGDRSEVDPLRLHLQKPGEAARVVTLVGTTAGATEAFDVRERLVASWGSGAETPAPHVEAVSPLRLADACDAVVVVALGRVTVARLVQVLLTIEERGGSVTGIIGHVPRRPLDRLRVRRSSS